MIRRLSAPAAPADPDDPAVPTALQFTLHTAPILSLVDRLPSTSLKNGVGLLHTASIWTEIETPILMMIKFAFGVCSQSTDPMLCCVSTPNMHSQANVTESFGQWSTDPRGWCQNTSGERALCFFSK